MESRFDYVAFLLRARYAVLGAGTLSIRKQGSTRTLSSVIPFPGRRCYVQEKDGRVTGSFMQSKDKRLRLDLDNADGLQKFMMVWDTLLLHSGFGASYIPVSSLAFLDTLIFAEELDAREIFAINPQTILPGGFALSASGEWTAPPALVDLARNYASNDKAMPETRLAASKFLGYVDHNEEQAFHRMGWFKRWMVNILRASCRQGREIASSHGVWREILWPGGLTLALHYLAGPPSRQAATKLAAMKTHFEIFMAYAKTGGCDLYILWNSDGMPTALAVVGANGKHASVSLNSDDPTFDRETAVGQLAEMVSVASPSPRPISRSG